MCLVGFLADPVTRGVIAANDVVPAVGALDPGTANIDRVTPHDLRVVQALVRPDARIRAVAIVLLLSHPQVHRGCTAETAAAALGKVLTVGPARVGQRAVADPLVSVGLRVASEGRAPCDVGHADLGPGGVVAVEVVCGQALGSGGRYQQG